MEWGFPFAAFMNINTEAVDKPSLEAAKANR